MQPERRWVVRSDAPGMESALSGIDGVLGWVQLELEVHLCNRREENPVSVDSGQAAELKVGATDAQTTIAANGSIGREQLRRDPDATGRKSKRVGGGQGGVGLQRIDVG